MFLDRYGDFVQHLDSVSRDTRCLAHIKKALLNTLAALLTERPEREQELLTALTNKLGDPDKKVSSKVVFLLTETIRFVTIPRCSDSVFHLFP